MSDCVEVWVGEVGVDVAPVSPVGPVGPVAPGGGAGGVGAGGVAGGETEVVWVSEADGTVVVLGGAGVVVAVSPLGTSLVQADPATASSPSSAVWCPLGFAGRAVASDRALEVGEDEGSSRTIVALCEFGFVSSRQSLFSTEVGHNALRDRGRGAALGRPCPLGSVVSAIWKWWAGDNLVALLAGHFALRPISMPPEGI